MGKVSDPLTDARPRVIGALAAQFRDLDLAEEAYGLALEALLSNKEQIGNVAGWLMVSARRKAVDILRRRKVESDAIEASALFDEHGSERSTEMDNIISLPDQMPDERLRLLFICCHPALALDARAALALRIICGVSVADIAQLFLVSEPAMYQRITRAKAKVHEARIPFEVPRRKDWQERLDAILLTLELSYTLAYQDGAGEGGHTDLGEDVERLSAMLAELCATEPEVLGFAALVTLAASRKNARVDNGGAMVPLSQQDVALWDMERIERARLWLERAAKFGRSGPYQIMATIQLSHASRAFGQDVDWSNILRLYRALLVLKLSHVVAINHAVAMSQAEGAKKGLEMLMALPDDRLESYRPYHASLARLHSDLGNREEAIQAYERALECNPGPAEKLFLERRRSALR